MTVTHSCHILPAIASHLPGHPDSPPTIQSLITQHWDHEIATTARQLLEWNSRQSAREDGVWESSYICIENIGLCTIHGLKTFLRFTRLLTLYATDIDALLFPPKRFWFGIGRPKVVSNSAIMEVPQIKGFFLSITGMDLGSSGFVATEMGFVSGQSMWTVVVEGMRMFVREGDPLSTVQDRTPWCWFRVVFQTVLDEHSRRYRGGCFGTGPPPR